MHDAVGVQVAHGHEDLSRNELDLWLGETPFLHQVVEDVAAGYILQEEIDAMVCLEHVVHGDDERVLRLEEDVLLSFCVEDLAALDQNILIDALHSVLLFILRVYDVENLAERAFIDDLHDFEVLQTWAVALRTATHDQLGALICGLNGLLLLCDLLLPLGDKFRLVLLLARHNVVFLYHDKIEELIRSGVEVKIAIIDLLFLSGAGDVEKEVFVRTPVDPAKNVFI